MLSSTRISSLLPRSTALGLNPPRIFTYSYSNSLVNHIKMSDEKSQDKVVSTSGEETKKADTSDNKKTEDTAADSGSTTEPSRPPRQLPTHYKGMPRQWEKNQVPKKDT
ncbi:hypothetical protein F4781DRAFT_389727 [Annulohypoxylon bovei var. microspora]|nr:hypothetical protein F4781DRAFT_389727 [Annulohypoxylon bovei var. microspora]